MNKVVWNILNVVIPSQDPIFPVNLFPSTNFTKFILPSFQI